MSVGSRHGLASLLLRPPGSYTPEGPPYQSPILTVLCACDALTRIKAQMPPLPSPARACHHMHVCGPSFMCELHAALSFSPRFVQSITGCGELSDKTDCSCNVYAKGGHLLCHDDVIGTRCAVLGAA
jgi:hypothetical protein